MLTYIDETGVDEYFHRDKCRAKRGVKVYGSVSGRKYNRTNIVAAQCDGAIIAPMEYTGTTDHYVFETWFEKVLLAQFPEGQTEMPHKLGPVGELVSNGTCRNDPMNA